MTDAEKRPSTPQEIMAVLKDRYEQLNKWADDQKVTNESENIRLMAYVANQRSELVAAALYNTLEIIRGTK